MVALQGIGGGSGGVMGEIAHAGALVNEGAVGQPDAEELDSSSATASRGTVAIAGGAMGARPRHSA